MKQMIRGERAPLGSLIKTKRFGVRFGASALQGRALDLSCFGLDAKGRLSDEQQMVFYNQPASPEGAVRLVRSEQRQDKGFDVDLAALPSHVQRLAFVATTDEAALGALGPVCVSLYDVDHEFLRFELDAGEFEAKRGLHLLDIYAKEGWRVAAIGDCTVGGLEEVLRAYGGEAASAADHPEPRAAEPVRVEAVERPQDPPEEDPYGRTPLWLARLAEDGGVRQFFERLDSHGVITEEEALGIFGGPRRLRKFVLKYDHLVAKAPFRVKIDTIGGVKRYIKEK